VLRDVTAATLRAIRRRLGFDRPGFASDPRAAGERGVPAVRPSPAA
jgi:hypothetical protein